MLQLGNKVYNLKSAKRRDRKSTRPMADGKTGFPAHDVERRDVSSGEVPGNEAGDNHEFIVRLRDDLPPRSLRGDAISPRKAPRLFLTGLCAQKALRKTTKLFLNMFVLQL